MHELPEGPHRPRRQFLTRAGLVLTGLAVPALGQTAASGAARPAAPTTPDEALAALVAGNERFVSGKSLAPHRDLARLKEVAPKQAPFAAVLGCADSRVPVEIVFDQGFGDVFVTRIAGNVADPAIIGSLEFGSLVLGAKVLYVLGHSNCGAVTATIKGTAVPGQISTLFQHLRPAVKVSGGDVAKAVTANVRNQMEILREASPVIAELVKDGKVVVAGGVYDLTTGKVTQVTA
jgi:carbonic anhydrase